MLFAQAGLIAAALVIRLAQMLWCVGATRSHSAAGAAGRLLLDFAVATVFLWAVGGIFIPDAGTVQWLTFSHALGLSETSQIVFVALPPLVLVSGTIVGATQDRVRALPMLLLTAVLAAAVVPLVYQGEIRLATSLGRADVDLGAAAVLGAAAALTAASLVRPRKSKFNRDLSVNVLPGHNVPLQYLAVPLLALGFAVYTGQTAQIVLAVSTATLAGSLFGKMMFSKVDTGLMLAAAWAGIVTTGTMSAAAPLWAAALAGLFAGGISPWALMRIETQFRIDDAAGMAAGMLCGGAVGLIVTPLCNRAGVYTAAAAPGQHLRDFGGNIILLIASAAIGAVVAFVICKAFEARKALRVTEDQEYEGVDLAEFDLNAYPDFQQTMIKSHHLRQL